MNKILTEEKNLSEKVEVLLKIMEFMGKKLMYEKSIGNEGNLLVTRCGHNGNLSAKNYRHLEKIVEEC